MQCFNQYTKDRTHRLRQRTRTILSFRKQPPHMSWPRWDDKPELG